MLTNSPCRGACQLDNTRSYCLGCHRTLDEIAQWSTFSDMQKEQVWFRLLGRPLQVEQKWCVQCGNAFECGAGGKNGGCWCQDLPNVMPLSLDSGDCLCSDCLTKELLSTSSPPKNSR